jgi:hypothetical protein
MRIAIGSWRREMMKTIAYFGRLGAIGVAVMALLAAGIFLCPQARGQSSSSVPAELLYVADSNGSTPDEHGQVLVIDPQKRAVVKTYPTRSHPDIALSPDGKRLYLAYYFDPHDKDGQPHGEVGKLDVIDTSSWTVVASANHSEWAGMGPAYDSSLALSNDGHWLYMYVSMGALNAPPSEGVAVFDTTINKFLPDIVSLPGCGAAVLVPWTSGIGLSVVCSYSSNVRSVQFNTAGVPGTRVPMGVAIPNRHQGATRFYQPGDNAAYMSGDKELTVVMGDGRFARLNLTTGGVVQEGAVQFSQPLIATAATTGAGAYDAQGRYVSSRLIQGSQGKIFSVLARNDRIFHAADAIAALDAKTLQQIALIQPGYLFWNAVLSVDGKRLYLISADADRTGKSLNGNIHILNSADGSEMGEITGVGTTPTILVPSP